MRCCVRTGTLLYLSDFNLMCSRNGTEQECCKVEATELENQRRDDIFKYLSLEPLRYPDSNTNSPCTKRALD